jgi:hypothetical protein
MAGAATLYSDGVLIPRPGRAAAAATGTGEAEDRMIFVQRRNGTRRSCRRVRRDSPCRHQSSPA